ncbi:MAG: CpaF family protein [Lachnospiraceae bacterium]|nr:CpaF family protein [Lachnospiraceae bacterium]
MNDPGSRKAALLKAEVMEALASSGELKDEDVRRVIEQKLEIMPEYRLMSLTDRVSLKRELFDGIRRLDILQELLDAEDITEIMVNGTGDVFYEKDGVISRWKRRFESEETLVNVIRRIAGSRDRAVNTSSPIVDVVLEDGSRVNAVLKPVALNGPAVTIRRFNRKPVTMEMLVEKGSLSSDAAELLKELVRSGYNIFISGSTGSGKTTFLNALSRFIDPDERVVTIEDPAELRLQNIRNLVRLEARSIYGQSEKDITIRDLIRTSLRMRPDRIIVGEVRGDETIDMLQAMNTGHEGSMSTGHGNSPKDMISRLETMVLMGTDIPLQAVRKQIASAIDIFVHLGRLRDRSRKVLSIEETDGIKDGEIQLNTLFRFEEDRKGHGNEAFVCGRLRAVSSLKNREKLERHGHIQESV